MATATSPDKENREDTFELELSLVRKTIESVFEELVECLASQKKDLFDQLNEILIRYQSYNRESDELTKRKLELEQLLFQNQGEFSTSVKSLQDKYLNEIEQELKSIVMPAKPKLVSFVCDEKKLLTEVNELCKLVERVNEIDYTSKLRAVISVCDKGKGDEQLNYPHGVAVDHNTGNIYVADYNNKCVKVFDSTAKFLFKFGDDKGEGKMSYPTGLCIRGNTILVIQSYGLQVYQLDGKFISRIGDLGRGKLQFNYPSSISTDEYNGDIYICGLLNNRIQVLSDTFQYKSEFGKDILHSARDVKLYKDNIFILDASNPCLHIFNRYQVLQRSVVTRGEGQQVINPWFLFLDKFGCILISDRNSNSVLILNSEFEFIYKISVSNQPMGITMDREDRVIVVCNADKDCLQIF